MSTEVASWSSGLGVLLIGHGTRDQAGLAEFAELVRRVADLLDPTPVEPAFLELASPTIAAGWDRLIERGVRQIVAAPLLLFAAGHAKQDIPAAIRAAASRHPAVSWRQAEPLGCHPSLLELSAQRFREATVEAPCEVSRGRLIVVGRGSRDPEATRETIQYAERVGERVGVGAVQTSFLAMAEPRLSQVLAEAAQAEWDLIVVQPHLLFHGELLGEVRQWVRDWSQRVPAKHWVIVPHLGPSAQVVTALFERCQEAHAKF